MIIIIYVLKKYLLSIKNNIGIRFEVSRYYVVKKTYRVVFGNDRGHAHYTILAGTPRMRTTLHAHCFATNCSAEADRSCARADNTLASLARSRGHTYPYNSRLRFMHRYVMKIIIISRSQTALLDEASPTMMQWGDLL